MTDATIVTQPPLPKHAWSRQYLRLRLLVFLLGIPVRFNILRQYYFRDPSVLRKYQVTRRRILVPSREKGRLIKVDVYEPINLANKPTPVHVHWHGSGFVIPCLGGDGVLCTYLASSLGCIVLDCDYRKAPVHPFPAAAQDAEDSGWLSAGGSLALGAAAKLGPDKIQAVCCFAPVTDWAVMTTPPKALDPGIHPTALPPWAPSFFGACYLVGEAGALDRTDPSISPMFAASSSLPKTVYIAVGTGDTLWNNGKDLIDRLQSDGHYNAIFRALQGWGHEMQPLNADDPADPTLLLYQDLVDTIRQSWSQPQRRRESKM